ncbi:MAG TPA: hypothetical protein VHV10_19120 [Ktedonobacteraceae bacterium]|jgi:hypothetical protein|nr:hypothetical protein [Ktedonobacteraceae bacterium]
MEGVKADIKAIRESQADLRDTLKTMTTKKDLAAMATKDDITRMEGMIQQLLQQMPGEGQ